MKKRHLLFISLLSGLLMTLAWINTMSLGFVMLIAFIPLLFVEDYIAENNDDKKFSSTAAFIYSYPAFFVFTFTNTWWISNASPIGYIVGVAEAAFMSVVFQCYSFSKKVAKNKQGAYFFLVLYWIAFEYIQFTWDINFPWLNLGNSLAAYPQLVQWYDVTGMEGGSLWILLSNIFLYSFIFSILKKKKSFYVNRKAEGERKGTDRDKERLLDRRIAAQGVATIIILFAPMIWSASLWFDYEEKYDKKANVVVVQPNLDPYNEQYVLSPEQVIDRVERLAAPLMNDSVDFLVLPESCIQEYAWEERLVSVPSIEELKRFVSSYENCHVIAGMSTQKVLPKGVKTEAAREFSDVKDEYFESCNTAICFTKTSLQKDFQIRHKSILVVGVEKLPFKKYLPFVEKLALNMGGTVGSLGVDADAVSFNHKEKNICVGVPICWESIDGNYSRKFADAGADFLQVITNVGWWGDTPGYKQYFAISRLRAIENRRYVSVCANTGYSGLINARGEVLQKGGYWQQEAFAFSIPLLKSETFFALHGDMIMRPFAFFSLLLLVFSLVKNKVSKKENRK